MPIPDVSTDHIYEGELPDVDSMSEVTDVRVITATGSGSEKVPIGEFTLPSSQIPYNPSVSGLEATNTKEAIDELTAKVNTKENAANKKTVINDSDTEFPTSKAVKTALELKLDKANVYNGLDKTEAGFALDARQGKVLNDNIYTLYEESIGNVHPRDQDKPTPPTTRRFRFTVSGDCSFEGVEFEDTGSIMEVPFPVMKDDELLVIVFGGQYYYKFFQNASKEMVARTNADNALQEQINSLDTAMGDISSALDAILLIGESI